jgi:hypothetical protein
MFTSYTKNNKITDDRKLKKKQVIDLTKLTSEDNLIGSYNNHGEPNFEMILNRDVENMENMAFYAVDPTKHDEDTQDDKDKDNEDDKEDTEELLQTNGENIVKEFLAEHVTGQIYLGALSIVGLYIVFKMMRLNK